MIWTYIHFAVLHLSYSPNTFAGLHNKWPVHASKVNLAVKLFHIFAYSHFWCLPFLRLMPHSMLKFQFLTPTRCSYHHLFPMWEMLGSYMQHWVLLIFFRKAPLQWEPSSQEELLIKLCLAVLPSAVKPPSAAFRQLTRESFSTSPIKKSSLFPSTLSSHSFTLWL